MLSRSWSIFEPYQSLPGTSKHRSCGYLSFKCTQETTLVAVVHICICPQEEQFLQTLIANKLGFDKLGYLERRASQNIMSQKLIQLNLNNQISKVIFTSQKQNENNCIFKNLIFSRSNTLKTLMFQKDLV